MASIHQLVQQHTERAEATESAKVARLREELDAAAAGSPGARRSAELLRILKVLKTSVITVNILRDTKVGHAVTNVKKAAPDSEEGYAAGALVQKWKAFVEASKSELQAPRSIAGSSSSSSDAKPAASGMKQKPARNYQMSAPPTTWKTEGRDPAHPQTYEDLTVEDIKERLRRVSVVHTGNKAALLARLKLFDSCERRWLCPASMLPGIQACLTRQHNSHPVL